MKTRRSIEGGRVRDNGGIWVLGLITVAALLAVGSRARPGGGALPFVSGATRVVGALQTGIWHVAAVTADQIREPSEEEWRTRLMRAEASLALADDSESPESAILSRIPERIPGGRVVTARVISRLADPAGQGLLLGAGTERGVEPGDPAMALSTGGRGEKESNAGPAAGVVGTIAASSDGVSRLLPVTSSSSRIAALLSLPDGSDFMGGFVLQGASPLSGMRLLFVPRDLDIRPGMIVKSDLSSTRVPPGLPIGVVEEVGGTDGLFLEVVVAPIAEPRLIRDVAIIHPDMRDTGRTKEGEA